MLPTEVPVEVAGQKHVLKFVAPAIARYELAHGSIVGVVFKKALSFGETAALLEAGLWHKNKEITLELASELLEEHICQKQTFTDVALKVIEAAWASRFIQALAAGTVPNVQTGDSGGPPVASSNGSSINTPSSMADVA